MSTKESGGWTSSTWTAHRTSSGVTSTLGTGTSFHSVLYQRTTGYALPNFYARKRRGDLLPYTNFRQYKLSGTATGSSDVQSITYPASGFRDFFDIYPFAKSRLEITEEHLENKINVDLDGFVQQAFSKIYSNSFDALTFLAEFHKTVQLFSNLSEKIRSMASGKPPGTPWNLWLEGRYGWRILLFDISNLQDALLSLSEKRSRFTERCGTTITWTESSTSTGTDTVKVATGVTTSVYTMGLRGSVCADIALPPFVFNPLVTGWELLKFSFVIDWFVNVGQTLSAMSALFLSTNYTAAKGFLVRCERTYVETAVAQTGYVINSYDVHASSSAELAVRVPCSVSLFPQIKVRLNVSKITDLLALALQALQRR